jgi:hypothetical protein
VEQPIAETGRDTHGNPFPQTRTFHRPCSCGGGLVVCSGCGGHRIVRCPGCAGSGQVKSFDQLVVRFQAATQGEVLDVTPVPDKWLGSLAGEVLVDQRAERIEQIDALPETVAEKTRDLLSKSHEVDERHTRIILQLLHEERLPLYEVRYKYAGVDRQLWICGNQKDVHAPKAPWNRQRMFWVVAGIVLAVAALIGLGVFLFR